VTAGLGDRHVAQIVEAFELGTNGRLSDGPVDRGRVGAVWQLDTAMATWAVKPVDADGDELVRLLAGAAFQEAVSAAGVPTPGVRRTRHGDVIAEVDGLRLRVHTWVDLDEPRLDLDPRQLGELVASLHRVDHAGTQGVHPWFTDPVGAERWSEWIGMLRARRAPFAEELDSLIPDLIALEEYLGGPPRSLRTCHRDLWADNVRRTADGGLCVFDFDAAGLADPAQELALVLVEFAGDDPVRGRAISDAYVDAGGPGRVDDPRDFALVIAHLAHIVEEGCRRWLAATDDETRSENEAWIREFIDRPLTTRMVDTLVAACRDEP
jgi:Ser/Thr protein kinase RdoA (MazF antagonist)